MKSVRNSTLRIGMLSTYPPMLCGLATFSSALTSALQARGHVVDVVRVDDGSGPSVSGRPVVGVLLNGSRSSVRRAARTLSQCDAAIIQHEFGIFGGVAGDEVLDVMRDLDVPVCVVLHTVPQQASGHHEEVLVDVCDLADVIVVMSEAARDRLVRTYYPIDASKVVVIPHGAQLASHVSGGPATPSHSPLRLLTWGLIGPGKGIEHVLKAIGLLSQLGVNVSYTIAGSTHPKVRLREGDQYRNALVAAAESLKIRHLVTFDEAYRGVAELTEFIASFDAVVLPYDTTQQVTSGVLVDSIAAGRAVIATDFPHAVEMLSNGPGLLVPHRDPRALAVAIHTLATEPEEVTRLQAQARQVAPTLSWQTVVVSYEEALASILARRERASA